MKVGIVLLGNRWICPYVETYCRIFDECGVPYDIISWNRDGRNAGSDYCYNSTSSNRGASVGKLFSYFKYASFVKKVIKSNNYDRLVISGPHIGLLIYPLLSKRYRGKFIFDYRDLSIDRLPLLNELFVWLVRCSSFNVVSSYGFIKHLPGGAEYLISHNFNAVEARAALGTAPAASAGDTIKVLTIGFIRNYDANVQVLSGLGGRTGVTLRFAGDGDAAAALQSYADKKNITNVSFTGYYDKTQEAGIVKECTFMNIYFPPNMEHSAIMSNRFYLALIHRKPMIVSANSVQGELVERYGLGVAVSSCENLAERLRQFMAGYDSERFAAACDELLSRFLDEQDLLEDRVKGLVSK